MKFRIWSVMVDYDDSLSMESLYPRLAEDKAFEKKGDETFVNLDSVSDLLRIGDETRKSLIVNSNDKDIRIDDDYF